jgi:predicted nucleic acid-binding protein
MILPDSSIWIDYFRDNRTQASAALEAAARDNTLLVGDVVMIEVLQGTRDERHARRIEKALAAFPAVAMLDPHLAIAAARNYRTLRGLGIIIRKTADLIIGTFCIEHGHTLLHADRDFEPMQRHLGLIALT